MKLIIKSLTTIFIISLMVITSFSQENKDNLRLSIREAQDFAVENNRTVKSSRVDVNLANKKIWENLATGLPQISVDANYLHQFVVPKISFGRFLDTSLLPDGVITKQDILDAYQDSPPVYLGVKDNTTIDLTLSQLVFNGQYFVGLEASRVVKDASEKSLVRTEDQIKESVADAYYSILVIQESINLLKESQRTLDQTYNELVKMNQLGLNEDTDVDQMNINRSNISTMLTSLESQKNIATKLLKYQLGLGFENSVILTDSLPGFIQELNGLYTDTPEFQVQNSIDYQLANIQENLSQLLVKLEKSKYLPTLSAFYRHEEQTNRPSFNFAVKDVMGASLNFPILSSGMRSSRVSQAKYDLDKVRLSKLDAEQGLTMEFETAWSSYLTAYRNFITNSESMDLSKKIYDRSMIKFREGVTSSFELAQNQNQFLTAARDYYTSLLSLLNAKAKLDRILRTN